MHDHHPGHRCQALESLHVLRDDGITYHEYVTELTFLLFLKMAKETGTEEQLPAGYRWDDLQRQEGVDQLAFYRSLLVHLGNEGSGRVQAIFHDANTALRQPRNLTRLVESIDALDWYSAREEGLGDLYEGLLEKNASEKKSGAGQYFTPRPLIECMVNCIQPQPGEIMQDPAAGTGGFLIMADRYIKQRTELEVGRGVRADPRFRPQLRSVDADDLARGNCAVHAVVGCIRDAQNGNTRRPVLVLS